MPAFTASAFSLPRSGLATPPCILSARTVATMTTAEGASPALTAFDVEELLRAQIGAEARLRSRHSRPARARSSSASTELQPWAMLAKGPPWTKAGVCSSVCTRFGWIASRSSTLIAPAAWICAAVTFFLAKSRATMMRARRSSRSASEVARQKIAITLGGDGDVEAVLAHLAVVAQADHDLAQRAVVHVHHAAPRDLRRIDAERVAPIDLVVDQRRQQVVGRGDAWKSPVKCRLISSIGMTWA